MWAGIQALEALVAEAGRLRLAAAEAESTLGRLEAELELGGRILDEANVAASELRARLAEAEADLDHARDTRRRWARSRRPASPPPRTLPLVERHGPQRNDGAAPSSRYEEVLRLDAELAQTVAAQRQELRLAERRVHTAGRSIAAKADEAKGHRDAAALLRHKVSQAPTETDLAAQLAAVGEAGRATEPTAFGLADIPADYLDLYRRAALTCPGLSWSVLAAIGSAESSHGRATLPGVRDGANSAGAMGPMQFLAETWAAYGVDGDDDGTADVYDPTDAVFGAANYLCASGAGDPARLAAAIWAYNHADWYVAAVLSRAAAYGTAALEAPPADALALVDHPNLALSDEARADLLSGTADPRLVAALAAAAAEHRVAVSVIKTGHAKYVRGTDRFSNHYEGRGVDIVSVDGVAVRPSNPAALALALALLTADPSLRPDEFGSPWPELSHFPGAFSDADHAGHLHLGWRPSSTPASPRPEGNSP